jgi:hypothetical protein
MHPQFGFLPFLNLAIGQQCRCAWTGHATNFVYNLLLYKFNGKSNSSKILLLGELNCFIYDQLDVLGPN